MSETNKGPCEEVLLEIEDLVRSGRDPLSEPEIAVHLRDCYPCDRVEFERRLHILLASKCTGDQVPGRLVERVRSIVRDSPPPPPQAV